MRGALLLRQERSRRWSFEGMTPKQLAFIDQYLIDGNATRASEAVGVPEASAATTASRWLKNPKIKAEIARRRALRSAKAEIAAEELDRQLACIATADPGRLYDKSGNRLPVHLLDDDTRMAIAVVEDETRGGMRRQKVGFSQKARAIELLYKRKGALVDRTETTLLLKDVPDEDLRQEIDVIERRLGITRETCGTAEAGAA